MQSTKKSTSVRRGKGGFVVGFLRQLFQSEKNSTTNAEDLHENGLLALEAGTPLQLHELDKLSRELMERNEEDDGEVEKWDNASLQRPYRCTSASVKQHSVSRVLASVQRHYQLATEAIPFAGLVELNKKPMEWEKLKRDVYLFIRLHAFTQVVDELIAKGNGTTPRTIEHSYLGFRWRTKSEAREKREEVRMSIITVSFPTNVTKQLTEALELWRTAQSVVQSFSKHCSNGDDSAVEAAVGLTLETLLSIQQSLQALAERKVHSLEEGGDVFWGGCDALQQPLVEELRFVGRVASCALAGAYAVEVHEKVRQECEEYFRGRANKMESVRTLLNEMYDLRQQMAQATTERCSELRDRLNEHMEEFFMLHQTLAEADGAMSNLCDMYTVHLPENANVLWTFPSSCVKCVGDQFHMPRFFRYERERTLADYTNVEEEPRNAVEPCKTPVDRGILFNGTEGCGKVGFTLLRAQLVDSVKGTVSNCWLKRYTFPVYEETTTRHQAVEIFRSLMERELSVHESCATHRVTCATEVFCEADARVVYFHVPKGRTQMRFNSTHDVGKRIARLGAKWLHDALQCIIDLHSCHLVHEDINLSCFTYDDFGNTTLGFFSNVLWDSKCGRKSALEDTVDFGALLHAEVLPYLRAGSPTAEPVHPQRSTDRCEKVQSAGFAVYQNRLRRCEETIDLFEEVASRLIGKLEPRWDLLDARAFVRRFLEINSDEREYLFSKEISYPPHWASWKGIVPVSMIPERWALCQLMPESTTVFLNRNVHLWEIYWKRRRKMVKNRGGGSFSMPAELKTLPCFLPCSDDCEVNERFLWYTCGSEEEAWTICLKGCDGTECVLSVSPPPMHDSKRAGNGNASVAWGVVFRVSLGTVVVGAEENVSDCGLASGTSPLPSVDCAIKNMRCNPVLIKRGSNSSASYDVVVFSPKQHCYPEYLVHWLQN
ncbi:hypothetical protein ERJ75_000935500 [Trypanosoma vivax]|nr:hypothetical protein ERJ75_000935500 [Trypanosoma vivax]